MMTVQINIIIFFYFKKSIFLLPERPPVEEVPSKVPAVFDIDPCINCIGADYKGTKHTTKSGKTCQRWDSIMPHNHTYNSAKYRGNDQFNKIYITNYRETDKQKIYL